MPNNLKNICWPTVDPIDSDLRAGYLWSVVQSGHARATRRPNPELHRLVAERVVRHTIRPNERVGPVHFVDGDPLNCRRANLRFHVIPR